MPNPRILKTSAAVAWLLVAMLNTQLAQAQPRFAVELGAGQNIGLTSYVDNVVVLQGDLPLLADELPGSGVAVVLDFVFSKWAIGTEVRFFDREKIRLHHRGTQTVPPNRVRADGSVDDAGIEYAEIDPVRSPSPRVQPGDLLLIDVGASYRFMLIDSAFTLWFPVGASVLATKILEAAQPTILGLGASTGIGMGYAIAPPVGIVLNATINGILTPAYRPLADASRGSYAAGETTEEAVFSSMAYGSVILGLQLTIR